MPLMLMKVGESGLITKISGKSEVRNHLAELGFVIGSSLTVVQSLSGSIIVKIKDSRIGLDKALASKIEVEV